MELGLEYLLKSEEITTTTSREYLRGIHENVPKIIDTIFKLPYYTGEIGDVETPEGSFLSICKITYMQSPYTMWSLYELYEKGYYLESLLLYRHLIESFIQLRYFHKHSNKLTDHINQTKRVNFSVMFNEFSPGFYKPYYSDQLSEAAHGFIFKDINRVTSDEIGNRRTVMGCEFDVDRATYVINMMVPLFLGFLNWFPKFFNKNIIDSEIQERINRSISWIEDAMRLQKSSNPSINRFYGHMDKYIR